MKRAEGEHLFWISGKGWRCGPMSFLTKHAVLSRVIRALEWGLRTAPKGTACAATEAARNSASNALRECNPEEVAGYAARAESGASQAGDEGGAEQADKVTTLFPPGAPFTLGMPVELHQTKGPSQKFVIGMLAPAMKRRRRPAARC